MAAIARRDGKGLVFELSQKMENRLGAAADASGFNDSIYIYARSIETYRHAAVGSLNPSLPSARLIVAAGARPCHEPPHVRNCWCPQASHLMMGTWCCGTRGAPERNCNATPRGEAMAGRSSRKHLGHNGTVASRRRLRRATHDPPQPQITRKRKKL